MIGLYVNGLSTEKNEAIKQSVRLTRDLGFQVVLEYNETKNMLFDIAEALWGRWLGRFFPIKFVSNLHLVIKEKLDKGRQVMLIAHSQGCLHMINAVNLLSSKERSHVYMALFASPTIYEPDNLFKLEYFYNDKDWVVSDLVRDWQKDVKKTYTRKANSHDFEYGYLDHIDEYKRDNGKTSLYASMVAMEKSDEG